MPVKDANGTALFAWAGFSLRIPESWEPVALEKDFVRFENDRGPRLECRWQHTQGTYRLDKRLNKAASQVKRAAAIRTGSDEAPVPKPFKRALDKLGKHGFQTRTFAWTDRAAQTSLPGALLHHAESDIALMLRTFPDPQPGDAEELAHTLSTARCHPQNGERPWSVFGLRAVLPGRLTVKTFSFKPGHFRIEFICGKHTRLSLERLGPARLVLKDSSLQDWAGSFFKGLNLTAATQTESASGWIVLGRSWPRGLSAWILRHFGIGRRRPFRLALALADEESKILSVRMEGPVPLTDEEFDKVCSSYEVV